MTIKISADDLDSAHEWMQGVEIIDKGGKIELTIGSEEECVCNLSKGSPMRPLIRDWLIAKLRALGIEPPDPPPPATDIRDAT